MLHGPVSAPGSRLRRAPPMMLALASLVVAAWAGVVRIGWPLPGAVSAPLAAHGPLMVCGFLGTLIAMERAVASGATAAYLAPWLTAAGVPALLLAPQSLVGPLLITAGSVGLVAILASMARRGSARLMVIMVLGAGCWAVGNLLWTAGEAPVRVIGLWAAFPVLTIVAERVELGRLTGISGTEERILEGAVALMLGGLLVAQVGGSSPPWTGDLGVRMTGCAALIMSAWLVRHDVALRRMSVVGLPRFAAVNLALACVWLGIAGAVLLVAAPRQNGVAYDAAYHGVFLGFAFSMIFAHAPIVFPAILGAQVPFRRWFYGHVAVLNGSLLLRVLGDAGVWPRGRPWGGLLNAVALLMFFGATVASVLLARVRSR